VGAESASTLNVDALGGALEAETLPADEAAALAVTAERAPLPDELQPEKIGTVSMSVEAVNANVRNNELDISSFDVQRHPLRRVLTLNDGRAVRSLGAASPSVQIAAEPTHAMQAHQLCANGDSTAAENVRSRAE
jgi:hypothetical protein